MTPVLSRSLAAFAALLLLLGLVTGCSGQEKEAEKPASQADSNAPAVQAAPAVAPAAISDNRYPLLDLAAFQTLIEDSKGKALLVCLWSVDCPACQQELPVLEQMVSASSSDDLRVVYAGLDSDPEVIAQFFGDYVPLADVVRVNAEVALETGAEYIPRLVIYDRQGNVSFKDSGFYPQAMLVALVQRAMGDAQ